MRASHADVVGVLQSGDRGVGRVGHVRAPVGQRPRDPRVDRAEAQVTVPAGDRSWSSSHCSLVADWLGASRSPSRTQGEAVADGAQVLPADARARPARRSCGPTRSSRRVGWRCRPRRRVRLRRARRARLSAPRPPSRARRTATMPSAGRVGEQLLRDLVDERCHRRRTTAARTLLVPTSMTSTVPFGIGLRPGEVAERRRESELARVEDAVRVERVVSRGRSTSKLAPSASATNRARLSPTPW